MDAEVGSPPARVAWIETLRNSRPALRQRVATREGGVDRNLHVGDVHRPGRVATREGGVDRNNEILALTIVLTTVATREGGVDRNTQQIQIFKDL